MPGPFNSASLPAIPSAAAGQNNIFGQLGQAAQQLPQMAQEQAQQKMEMQKQKMDLQKQTFSFEETQRTQGMQKLQLYHRMLSADQTGSKLIDPVMMKAVNDAAKAAGLGPMTIRDVATGHESIDLKALDHVINSKLMSDLTPQQKTELDQATPTDRLALLKSMNVDPTGVDSSYLAMRPQGKETDRVKMMDQVRKVFADAAKNGQPASSVIAQLNLLGGEDLAFAGITPDKIKEYLGSEAYQSDLSPAITAKMQEMKASGLKDREIAAWYKQRTIDDPKALQQRITYENGRLTLSARKEDAWETSNAVKNQIAQQNATTRAAQTQASVKHLNSLSNFNAPGYKLAMGALDKSLTASTKAMQDIDRQATAYSNNNKSVPDEIIEAQIAAHNAVAQGQATIQEAAANVQGGINKNFTQVVGKAGTISGTVSGMPLKPKTMTNEKGQKVMMYPHKDHLYYPEPEAQ